MANNPGISEVVDKNGVIADIEAKRFDGTRTVQMQGDVTATQTWNGDSNTPLTLNASIGAKKVTQDKIGDKAVGSGQMADGSVGLTQMAASAMTDTVSANNSKLVTSQGVNAAIAAATLNRGKDYGPLSVDEINAISETIPTGSTVYVKSLGASDAKVINDGYSDGTMASFSVDVGEDLKYYRAPDNSLHGWYSTEANVKVKQPANYAGGIAVDSAQDASSGSAGIEFVQSLKQDTNGNIRDIVKAQVDIVDSTSSTRTNAAATPNSVKSAYDLANTANTGLENKLDKTGDGKDVTATFTEASERENIGTGEKLSVMFGKIKKWFTELKALAFKDTVSDSDFRGTISDSHIASASTWNGKADKVSGATNGNFAALDSNGNLTDSGKSYSDLEGTFASQFSLGSTEGSRVYTMFARISDTNVNDNVEAQVILSSAGNYGTSDQGTWEIIVSNRGSTASSPKAYMTVRYINAVQAKSGKVTEPTFGYYIDTINHYIYFGIYSPPYRGQSRITVLVNNNATLQDFGDSTTAPTGWTTVTPTGVSSAVKLDTARTIQTDLASTSSASFDGTANITPGVTGTLPVANGGTGATTPAGAQINLIDKATTELSPMEDKHRIAIMSPEPSATNSVIAGYRTGLTMWNYIKGKMSSDTGVNISGNAATATKPAVTTLTSSDNLDNVGGSTAGDVLWYQWASGSAPANVPIAGYSVMEVVRTHSNKYITQTVYTTDHSVYRRECINGTWGAWYAYSKSTHTHGNITSGGALQTTDVAIANGDKLVVTDSSDSSKVARSSIAFDGSTTTKALTPKGTFEAFAKSGDITTAIQALDVSSVGGDGKYISAISETDGKISAAATTMDTTPTANSTKAVTSGGIKTALDGKQDSLSFMDDSEAVAIWADAKTAAANAS